MAGRPIEFVVALLVLKLLVFRLRRFLLVQRCRLRFPRYASRPRHLQQRSDPWRCLLGVLAPLIRPPSLILFH